MKLLSRSAGIAAALVAALAFATTAHADPLKCKQEINKDFSKFVQAKMKAKQKCEEAVAKAKIAGPCPDATAAAKITKAESKLRAGIAKQCGGTDKVCGGAADESLGAIGFPSVCTNFVSSTCTNVITDCGGISDCLICVGEAAVDQSISLYYDDLATGEFGSNSTVNKCQVAIGKNATKFLNAKNKALQKCEDGVMKATILGPCPDAVKALPAIVKAESKKRAGICKACGGTDKVCGGAPDLTPAQIGFAGSCPSSGACGGAISNMQDIVDCVDCVSEFNADCLDALGAPSLKTYPLECNAIPVPCPTATPGKICPARVVTEANGEALDLDTGWTGQSHDGHAPSQNRLTLAVSGCTHPNSTTCGVCNTLGPLTNPGGAQFNTQRCINDTHFSCTVNADCVGPGLPGGNCSFFFGGPLPLSAGGVSVCVTNRVTGPISGTLDVEGGTTANTISLLSRVFVAATLSAPCPTCDGGICAGGTHAGEACVVNGHSNLFGDISFDCPPDPSGDAGGLAITLAYDTGTQTRTLTAANPACRAQPGKQCFCDTCNNAAATPCSSNADCVSAGATICGGRRCQSGTNVGAPCSLSSECPGGGCGIPGQQTKANQCDDLTCSSSAQCMGGPNAFALCSGPLACVGGGNGGALCSVDSECPGGTCDEQCPGGTCVFGNEGTCFGGPFDTFCEPKETFRGCLVDGDCQFPGDLCTGGKFRDCFTDNGDIGGSVSVTGTPYPTCGNSGVGTIGALFCVPPTSSTSVNSVSGLPGLGRVALPYAATFLNP